MNIPKNLTNRALAALAKPDETHGIRVVIRRVSNLSPYTIRGRIRHYTADYNASLRAHVIDVPASVWMEGVQSGPYRENLSIAHDLQGNRAPQMAPLVFLSIPWRTGETKEAPVPHAPKSGVLDALRQLAEVMDAPSLLLEAIDLAASDRGEEAIVKGLIDTVEAIKQSATQEPEGAAPVSDSTPSQPEQKTAPDRLSNAERQRRYRAKKKAKKVAKKTTKAAAVA